MAFKTRPVLITGGAGFVGCNLADRLASQGENVIIYDGLYRDGVEENLQWLERKHPGRIISVIDDIGNLAEITNVVRESSAVFHLAAQVAVTTSLTNPLEDFEVNARGTLNVLEAVRRYNRNAPVIFASTNKVYGSLNLSMKKVGGLFYAPYDVSVGRRGISEAQPLDLHSPYGCSKGAADQYVLDYARSFGLKTAVLRKSCIYGERQLGTEDQGWVAHFVLQALRGRPITIFGDGCQVRDLLHVGDAVSAYIAARDRIELVRGRAFNLGGGPRNAVSLLQLIAFLERLLGRRVEVQWGDWREGDQKYYVSDTSAAETALALTEFTPWQDGVGRLVNWLQERTNKLAA